MPLDSDKTVHFAGDPMLPPAGPKREEELSRRKDFLEEKAEVYNENAFSLDPSAFVEEREIQSCLDSVSVSEQPIDADGEPTYKYKWCYDNQGSNVSQHVIRATGKRVLASDGKTYPTWQVVGNGPEFPEALECKQVDGTRRVGDTILLRCHRNTFAILERIAQRRNEAVEKGVNATLEDKARSAGTITHNFTKKDSQPLSQKDMQNAHVDQLSKQAFTEQLKQGQVAGMEIGPRV